LPLTFLSADESLAQRPLCRSATIAKKWIPILLIATLCGFCRQASAQTETAIGAKIIALQRTWNDAVKARDTAGINAILNDRVLLVNGDGSVQTKGDYLAGIKASFTLPRELQEQVVSCSLSVKVFGKTAVVLGDMWLKGIEHGKPYLHHERFLDTWKYGDGVWTIVGTQATPVLR
jgi:ketosteroid isomerase-like protein